MTQIQPVNLNISPLLAKTVAKNNGNGEVSANQNQKLNTAGWSPILSKSVLAQSKQILPVKEVSKANTPASRRVAG